MFDISFAELMIIMIVGLIVLGPERLPVVARTIGHLLGRAQRYVERVKSDLRDEIELDNLRKLQNTVQDNINTLKDSLNKEMSQIQKSADISLNSNNTNTDSTADVEPKTIDIRASIHTTESPESSITDSSHASPKKLDG